MRAGLLVVCLWAAASVFAEDAQLAALHMTLLDLHSRSKDTFGGTPELTTAKHQLREWVETQLQSLKDTSDTQALSNKVNQALEKVNVAPSADSQNLLGSLGNVVFSAESGLLIVTTAVGINCQYDESAYAYRRVDNHWQRLWESEQNDYAEDKYAPQHIDAVHVSQRFKDGHEIGPAFVMTLGNAWGCASAWHPVYYRVWRIDSSGSKNLIDESEFAWLRTGIYIVGSIVQDWKDDNSPVDVLIEFTQRSIDGGVHNREGVRHFLIDGDRVRRVDPIALSPRDMVDEWLTHSWSESSAWSASSALQAWHRKLHADFVAAEFSGGTMQCQAIDLYQVGIEPLDARRNFEPKPEVFFLVRWRPPFHLTIMNISDKSWPRCNKEDPEADAWRTLFATQEWRE